MSITISGYSDDGVSIGGDLADEFDCYGGPGFIACSDGSIIKFVYAASDTSTWCGSVELQGAAEWSRELWTDEDRDYSDKIKTEYPIEWVEFTKDLALAKRYAAGRRPIVCPHCDEKIEPTSEDAF